MYERSSRTKNFAHIHILGMTIFSRYVGGHPLGGVYKTSQTLMGGSRSACRAEATNAELCSSSKGYQLGDQFDMKVILLIKINNLQELGGGQEGIRTLETVTRLRTFQARAFDHSATCPRSVYRRSRWACKPKLPNLHIKCRFTRRFCLPLLSILPRRKPPISLVRATWVPPQGCKSITSLPSPI